MQAGLVGCTSGSRVGCGTLAFDGYTLSPFCRKSLFYSSLPSISPGLQGGSNLWGPGAAALLGTTSAAVEPKQALGSISQNLSALSGTTKEPRCNCRCSLKSGEMENSCYR